ncbi:membrane protein [Bacteroidia bacterium]|nr:membrane protein [Bacteroidia bacterium]
MMTMKKIAFIFALCAASVGCHFLDEPTYTELDSGTVFSSPQNVELVVNGCYAALQKTASNYLITTDLTADYVCIFPGRNNKGYAYYLNGIFSYTDSYPENLWTQCYSTIYNCNLVIDNINKVGMADNLRKRYLGEVRLLRGWCYLLLTNLFVDVPLRTSSEYGEGNYNCHLSTQQKIYDFLLEDLHFAEEHLWDHSFAGHTIAATNGAYKANERFRASVDTAIGLQALAFMYRAHNDSASPWWTLARDKALHLIDRCGGLDGATAWLSPSYEALYRPENNGKFHQESLLAIYFSNTDKGLGTNLGNAWAIFNRYTKGQYNGYLRITNKWYNYHFAGHQDLRNQQMIHHEFYNAGEVKKFWPSNQTQFAAVMGRPPGADYIAGGSWTGNASGPVSKKYDDENATSTGNLDNTVHLLRYSDVLLIFAEAENELNGGPTPDACKALNAVRARALLADVSTGMTYDAFLNLLLEEREREFFCEGKRLFDLNRREIWGEKVSASDDCPEYHAQAQSPVSRIRVATHKYFAIPRNEVDANRWIKEYEQ